MKGDLLNRGKLKVELLNRLILDTAYSQNNEELFETALKEIASIINIEFGYVAKFTEEEHTDRVVECEYNLPKDFLDEVNHRRLSSHQVMDRIRKKVHIFAVKDLKNPQMNLISKKFNFKTIITVPIGYNGIIINEFIILFSREKKEDLLEYKSFLETVGNTLWIIIQNHKMSKYYQNNIVKAEKLKALGELSSGIAHDFNNLLTTILGFSQVALTQKLDDNIKSYINIIYKTAIDGKKIIERIQSFNKNHFNSQKEVCSINSIVESSLDMVKPRWKNYYDTLNTGLKIVKELNSKEAIYCVEHEIREVVVNLLLNAMDAMEDGGILTIRTYDLKDRIVLEIKDTGIGMTKEVREDIFKPFYTTKGSKGTGLGLSISKEIMDYHNGIIKVDSKLGEGTIFKLYFEKYTEAVEKTDIIDGRTNSDLDKIEDINVLVIDDDEQVGETIVLMLNAIGLKAVLESECDKIIDKLSSKKYDIIIGDLAMPKLNGIELGKLVKQKYPDIKFIILTGWIGKVNDEASKFIDYILRKPCTIEELSEAINEVL